MVSHIANDSTGPDEEPSGLLILGPLAPPDILEAPLPILTGDPAQDLDDRAPDGGGDEWQSGHDQAQENRDGDQSPEWPQQFQASHTYPQATLRGTGGPPRLPPGPPIITAPGGGPPARPSGS